MDGSPWMNVNWLLGFHLFTNRVLWGCHLSEQEGKLPTSRNYSILFRLTVSQVNYVEMSLILKKGQVTIEIDCCHRA